MLNRQDAKFAKKKCIWHWQPFPPPNPLSVYGEGESNAARRTHPEDKPISRQILVMVLLALVAGCVPATVPRHLAYTPGAPVQILDNVYDAGVFRVQYPAAWVAVSSPANQPAAVTLVAPDESAIIRLSTHPDLEPMPDEDLPNGMRLHTQQTTMANGVVVTLTLGAPIAGWDAYMELFEAVEDSLTAEQATETP
jgi:hypothetical protein